MALDMRLGMMVYKGSTEELIQDCLRLSSYD